MYKIYELSMHFSFSGRLHIDRMKQFQEILLGRNGCEMLWRRIAFSSGMISAQHLKAIEPIWLMLADLLSIVGRCYV